MATFWLTFLSFFFTVFICGNLTSDETIGMVGSGMEIEDEVFAEFAEPEFRHSLFGKGGKQEKQVLTSAAFFVGSIVGIIVAFCLFQAICCCIFKPYALVKPDPPDEPPEPIIIC